MIRIRRVAINNFKQLQEIDLTLPEKGRFLVQGPNESGKSSLFEAIFFGIFAQPLVTETAYGRFADLIRYDMSKAYIEIWLETAKRVLKIYRTIRRKRANIWRLDIEGPDGVEEVRGNNPVNERILAELGFDGEALLNTCFVEQKKLQKLEGMSRGKREHSLMTLLNLDQMLKVEEGLEVKGKDERELDRCKMRYKLAEAQADLPHVKEQLAKVRRALLFTALRAKLQEIAASKREVRQLAEEIASLKQKCESLRAKVNRVEALQEGMRALAEILSYLERIEDQKEEVERLERDLEEREQLRKNLPALLRKLQGVNLLRSRLERLAHVRSVKQESENRLRSISEAFKELAVRQEQLVGERERLRKIEKQIEEEAKRGWAGIRELTAAFARKREERDRLWRRVKLEGAVAGTAFVLAVVSPLRYFLGLLALGLGAHTIFLWSKYRATGKVLEKYEWYEHDVEELKDRLDQLSCPAPELTEMEQIPPRGISDMKSLCEQVRQVERRLGEAVTRRKDIEKRIADLKTTIAGYPDKEEMERTEKLCHMVMEKAEGILERWTGKAEELAAKLSVEVELDLASIRGMLGRLKAELEQMRSKIQEIRGKKAQAARRKEKIAEFWAAVQELYQGVQDITVSPPWSQALSAEDYTELRKNLRAEYDELGGEEVRQELEALQEKVNRKQGERQTRKENVARATKDAREIVSELELEMTLTKPPTTEEIERLLVKIQALKLQDEDTLLERQERLQEKVGYLRRRIGELESTLGLEGELLDLEKCQKELEEKKHSLALRGVATRIVQVARRRIMEKVLPSTIGYMRKLLPRLTLDRYYDAELTDDYHIRVWDERADDWKRKNIFSGGTKDQFSLALRLSFALATLPEERGAAPSFILLDEPLGSFDRERGRALLYLLSEGDIAENFDQIFLISHVQVPRYLFNYHISMDGGKIVEDDLPPATLTRP